MRDYKTGKERPNTFVDEEDKIHYYDYLCQITVANLYGIANREYNDEIVIKLDDEIDEFEKYVIHLSLIISEMFQDSENKRKPIYLRMSLSKYIHFIISEFGFHGFKNFKRLSTNGKGICPIELLHYEAEANNLDIFMFVDIYNEYYKKGKKK